MKKTLVFVVMILIVVVAVCGCTENFSQDAIDGPTSFALDKITSNGGIAVKATDDSGSYLYYINGYVGADGDNVFGEAVKGSILRVAINADGTIDYDRSVDGKPAVIVPKNVYASIPAASGSTSTTYPNKSAGLFIDGEYIYYTSPSTNKDADGNYKTSNMVILRTRLDGTDTEIITSFTHYNVLYGIYNGYLMYYDISTGELHRIDLEELEDTTVDTSVTSCVFPDITGAATDNWVFYSKASTVSNATHTIIYKTSIDATSNGVELINGKDSYSEAYKKGQIGDPVANEAGFSLTVAEVKVVGDKVMLIYKKSDSGEANLSKGIYTITMAVTSLSFDETKECLMSKDGANSKEKDSYTSFYMIDENNALCSNGENIQWRQKNGTKWKSILRKDQSDQVTIIKGAVKIIGYEKVEQKGVVTYIDSSNKVQKIHIANYASDGTIENKEEAEKQNAITIIDKLSVSSTWLNAEIVDDNIYYFNSDVSNYTYVYYISTLVESETVYNQENAKNRFISIATEVDKASLIK